MPCLEPSGAWGMRTMLTDMAHPPLQGLGQGVLGEAHLVVGHGVRVEGDQDLPAHEGDLLPVQEHLAVLLPVPDPEKGHGALAAADESVRLLLTLYYPEHPRTVEEIFVRERRDVQGYRHPGRLVVLDHLACLLGVGPGVVRADAVEEDFPVK